MIEAAKQRKKRLAQLKAQARLLEDEIRYLYPDDNEIKVPELPKAAKDRR